MALVLVLDLHHAKQVDMKKMKESTVYNYKVQFEPQISFLDNLDKLAGDDKNFDIKSLIQNLNTVEEKKPQDTNSPTDDDDLDFALPTVVLPPVTPPIALTTVSTVSTVSTEVTTKMSVPTTTDYSDLPEVATEFSPSKPIELPPSKTALIDAVKPLERGEECGWTTGESNHPPVFQPVAFNFLSSMFPFYNLAQYPCQCHRVVFIPQFVLQPRYLMQGLHGFRLPTFGGGYNYNYNTNVNNKWEQ